MSHRKLMRLRRSDLQGKAEKKLGVRKENSARSQQRVADCDLFELVMSQAELRFAAMPNFDPRDPLSVYVENEALNYQKLIDPRDLPPWRKLGQQMKILLLHQIAIDIGGYAFSLTIRDELTEKWNKESLDPAERINRIMSESLVGEGFKNFAYFYVIEGKKKGGRAKADLHLHGTYLNQDMMTPTKFKVAMERRLGGLKVEKKRRHKALDTRPAHDNHKQTSFRWGAWGRYIVKNVMKNDKRLSGSRIFISQEATKTAEEFWKLIRHEPL